MHEDDRRAAWVLLSWLLLGWFLPSWFLLGWFLPGWFLPGWLGAVLAELDPVHWAVELGDVTARSPGRGEFPGRRSGARRA